MQDHISKILMLLNLVLYITGCNQYSLETSLDKVSQTQACTLKNYLLKQESSLFSGSHKLELNLDKSDRRILASFTLSGINKSAFFKTNSYAFFKIINQDNSFEELQFCVSTPQEKFSMSPTYISPWNTSVLSTMSVISIPISHEQIEKISNAHTLEFSLQTIDSAITGELSYEELQPIRDFVWQCY